ncbi:TonB-dependent receptor [Psychroserpens damuponensis]|uniref:TonB-dependent receptor n=1 Tax=Psychroserpens damuponensis TaxID=943936 RepID=UPI00058FE4D0|nr:TonB-dependent receptor [Psychroserpens damuponensis]
MEKKIYSLLVLFFICVGFINAQKGIVAGNLIDGEFVEPMAFANILVKGTTTGTTSDFDGKYELELDPGTYTLVFSFVGYNTQEIVDVVIKAGEVTELDVTLQTNSLDTIVLTTSVKKNTESAVLNLQKKSVTLLDGLSAQAIKSSGAGNVAAAVKNVPGVSIQGGKYVYVRGLGDRYTKSILNGIDIPGLDPDRNTIQMDLFPTSILDNVIVLKSAAAEYPADFTGGIVDIITKDFPTKGEYSISLGGSYNPDMHFNDSYLTSEGSDTDIFGYDDGTRDLPIHRYQPIPATSENNTLLTTLTNSFQKELAAKQEQSGMDVDFGFTLGNQYDIGDDKIGYQASFSYKNTTTFYENRIDGAYIKNPQDTSDYELLAALDSQGSEGINNVILNGLAGIAYKTDKSKFKVNILHIQNGESSAGFFNQLISQDGTGGALEPLTKNAIAYTERSITNLLVTGKHRLNSMGDENAFNFEWKLSPTFSKVMDKGHRITPLQQSDSGNSFLSPSASTFPIQLWRNLLEESWNGKVDFDKTFQLFDRPAKVKFGGAYTYKFRDFSIDDYTFNIRGNQSFIADGDVNSLLASDNVWNSTSDNGTYLINIDTFNANDAYEGEQHIGANYVSLEFNVSEKMKTVLGVRTEFFKSYYTGQDGLEIFDRDLVLDEFDIFPSANVIYALNDDDNLRASYSRTTARPSFKEQSNSQIFDPITGRLFIGALGVKPLVPTYVNNFDLRYEHFGEKGQMFAISGFYKGFTDAIEQQFFVNAPTQLTVGNLGDANVIGAEFEVRQRLGFITEGLNDLKINANVSIIKSELTMSDDEYQGRLASARDGETIDKKRDLQGQAPYLINVGLDYNNDDLGLQTGLFFNVQGKTLEVVGIREVPDVYTKPFNSLNFTLNKTFGENENTSIDLKVSNILGNERISEFESYNAQNQIFTLRDPGTAFSLGYTYKF